VGYARGVIEAEGRFKNDLPGLVDLYERFVEPVFQAFPQGRNAFIQAAVPFLYEVVGATMVIPLVMHFYDTNSRIFKDTRKQHEKEAITMLKKIETEFEEHHLSEEERGIYELLDDRHRTAFRIMRGLAAVEKEAAPVGVFYLSCDHLGARMEIVSMQANRVIKRLWQLGIIEQIEKGQRRTKGIRAKAGRYKWRLPTTPTV
jgi:ribosomal protein S25